MTIAIVGAGPVGSYTAYLLSKQGFKVLLFDQKRKAQVGKPIQCTGLLTNEIKKFLPLHKDFLVNTFSQIKINSPNQRQIVINKTEYLIDRQKFDQHLLKLALQAGTIFHPEHKLIKIEKNQQRKTNLIFQNKNKTKIFSPNTIIGADGPLSLLYFHLNPNKKKTFYCGIQALIKGKFDNSSYQTFFGQQVCPDLFAWLVPESKTKARLGLATLKNPNYYFNNFLKKLNVKPHQILKKEGGLIPLFDPKIRTRHKNIFLLGDAANHVKASTLGGIIPAFQETQNLVNSISLKKPYQPKFKNLKLHLFLRKTLNRFSDSDYNKLVYLLSKPKNQKTIEQYSRENPKKLLKRLIIQEPRLLYFAKHLF